MEKELDARKSGKGLPSLMQQGAIDMMFGHEILVCGSEHDGWNINLLCMHIQGQCWNFQKTLRIFWSNSEDGINFIT